jgi:hypothetical protein
MEPSGAAGGTQWQIDKTRKPRKPSEIRCHRLPPVPDNVGKDEVDRSPPQLLGADPFTTAYGVDLDSR